MELNSTSSEEGKLLKRKDFLGVDEEAGSHPNRTYYYRKSSDLQKIIETCTRKLQTDSRNAKALFLRGNALLKLRDYHGAATDLTAFLVSDPNNTSALYSRGIALSKIGQPEKAIADMTKVLQYNPDHVNAAFARAACYNAIGQFTKAIEDYNFALLKDETGQGVYSSRGTTGGPLNNHYLSGAMGVEVQQSPFTHDDSKSPLPWMSPTATQEQRRDRLGGAITPGADKDGSSFRSFSPTPIFSHDYESEGNSTVSRGTNRTSRTISNAPLETPVNGHLDSHKVGTAANPYNTKYGTSDKLDSNQSFPPNEISSEQQERSEKEYALGYQCRKQGDFSKAIEHYTNAIRLNPSSFKSVFNRGFAYDKLEDFTSAIRDYSAAVSIEPNNAFAYYNRGISYDRSGDARAACEDFAKAISIQPNNVDFLHNYANCLRKSEKYEDAVVVYQNALDLSPANSFKSLFNKGSCLEKLDRFTEALEDYTRALKLQPMHALTLINRASVYMNLNRLDEATGDIDTALRLKSLTGKQRVDATAIRASILEKQGRLTEALAIIDGALAANKGDGSVDQTILLSTRASIYKSSDEFTRAIQDLTQAIRLNPQSPVTCYSLRGFCWRKIGKYEDAIQDYTKCIEFHMTHFNSASRSENTLSTRQMGARHYNNRAYCFAKLGRYQEAVGDYSSAISLDPANAHAYHNRGTSYDKLGQGDLAIADFTKVLELDSADGNATTTTATTTSAQVPTPHTAGAHSVLRANSFSNSPRHNAGKTSPNSPGDRSISTLGEGSVAHPAMPVREPPLSRGTRVVTESYTTSVPMSPLYNSRPTGYNPQQKYPPDAVSHREASHSVRGRQPNAEQDAGVSHPKYSNWNAARVNNALETAAAVAAAPLQNTRVYSSRPESSQGGAPYVNSYQNGASTGIKTVRPGSAPPSRPKISLNAPAKEGTPRNIGSSPFTQGRSMSPLLRPFTADAHINNHRRGQSPHSIKTTGGQMSGTPNPGVSPIIDGSTYQGGHRAGASPVIGQTAQALRSASPRGGPAFAKASNTSGSGTATSTSNASNPNNNVIYKSGSPSSLYPSSSSSADSRNLGGVGLSLSSRSEQVSTIAAPMVSRGRFSSHT